MVVRKIVKIDEEKCDGCGQCITNCHEEALAIVDGKARIVKEAYCDGLGACIGKCPLDAITIEEREAAAFDEQATNEHVAQRQQESAIKSSSHRSGCPGIELQQLAKSTIHSGLKRAAWSASQLTHWPIQLALVPPNAPFLKEANVLLVADCVPFAVADFHSRFLNGHVVIIGCPKLDNAESHVDKLTAILKESSIRSLTILHMEVPCCTGLSRIATTARQRSGRQIRLKDLTVSIADGSVTAEKIL